MTIGERIKQKRLELGMTQEELARLVGYKDKSAITKIEKSTRDFPQIKLESFAKALGVSTAELLGKETAAENLTFSYCLEKQMQILGYSVLYDSEGNVLLNHDDTLIEITDADVKGLETRLASYLNYMLNELKKNGGKEE